MKTLRESKFKQRDSLTTPLKTVKVNGVLTGMN